MRDFEVKPREHVDFFIDPVAVVFPQPEVDDKNKHMRLCIYIW